MKRKPFVRKWSYSSPYENEGWPTRWAGGADEEAEHTHPH